MTRKRILIISGHDFRSRRKASIHFIAQHWAEQHDVRFFSTGFSTLSVIKNDPRLDLARSANRVEVHSGVECYLQRTLVHPFALPGRVGQWLNDRWICHFGANPPPILAAWMADSDVVLIDAGLALAYVPLLRTCAASADWLYHASDSLATIGSSANLRRILDENLHTFSGIRVPASHMAAEFAGGNVAVLPHGIDPACAEGRDAPNPFDAGRHAVAIGSMLFDPAAVDRIAERHAGMTVHVIGGGRAAGGLARANIRGYPEMPFAETQAYIHHADLAIAPYDLARVKPYMGESSLKLAQFGYHGVPAVCPEAVVADQIGRFGYCDTKTSLDDAVDAALEFGRFAGIAAHGWRETADSFLAMADGTRVGTH